MKAGNTMQYKKVTLEDALALRMRVNEFIWSIEKACLGNGNLNTIEALDYTTLPPSAQSGYHGKAVVQHIEAKGNQPQTFYRQVRFLQKLLALGLSSQRTGRRRLHPRRVWRRYFQFKSSMSSHCPHQCFERVED